MRYTVGMGYWSFAIVNNKLAEIHYEEKPNGSRRLYGHCHVKRSEYKTKLEKRYIEKDTKHMRFSWRKEKYKYLGTKPVRYTTGDFKELLSRNKPSARVFPR
jgi:hypothetical protein